MVDSSLRGESADSPKQSKVRESGTPSESMTQKRINELDSPINDKNFALEIC